MATTAHLKQGTNPPPRRRLRLHSVSSAGFAALSLASAAIGGPPLVALLDSACVAALSISCVVMLLAFDNGADTAGR